MLLHAPAGLLAATHSWKQPARVRPALDTSAGTTTLPCVHSGIDSDMPVKTRGTGLYHDLPLHWTRWRSHEGEEAAPRARRKPDPNGVGTCMRTLPLPEDTGDANAEATFISFIKTANAAANALYYPRGVDGHLGEGGHKAVQVYRLRPIRLITPASWNSDALQ